jgi:hypothetical protein
MSAALTILTTDDLAPVLAELRAIREALAAGAQPADDYLSIDQVAATTGTSARTVRKWIKEGKYDLKGRLIKLFTLEFSPGMARIPRSALLAFGQALGFDAAQLPLPPARATAGPVLHSEQALRKAS